jgi:hypothetical protein
VGSNIKLDLLELGFDGAKWIQLAQDSFQLLDFVKAVMNLWVPQRKENIF